MNIKLFVLTNGVVAMTVNRLYICISISFKVL